MAIFWGSPEARIHRGTVAEMDTVDYTDSRAAVYVDMTGTPQRSGQRAISGGYAEGDRFISIEGVWGSALNDNLIGDGGPNALFGHHGNDRITGGPGGDTLSGEAGADTVEGGLGNDALYGGADADTLSGGAGRDALHGDLGEDTVTGGTGMDVLYGGKGVDVLIGGRGGQLRDASEMAESLEGGAGADLIYGDAVLTDAAGDITGPGSDETYGLVTPMPTPTAPDATVTVQVPYPDFASYTLSNERVIVDLSGAYEGGAYSSVRTITFVAATPGTPGQPGTGEIPGTPGTPGTPALTTNVVTLKAAAGGHAAGDVLHGINSVRGSAHDDVLIGDSGVNFLFGNQGADTLMGGGGGDTIHGGKGADTLMGGAGNDALVGGAGADSLAGGAGSDEASYWNSPSGVSIDLTKRTAQSGGHAEGDTIAADVSRVNGSYHPDLIIGGAEVNQFAGDRGNDWDDPATALTAAGARTPAARAGLFGGAGNDILNGGDGNDLLAGEAGDDPFLQGGPGNDYLHGGAGNDSLAGGPGNDTLHGGAGSDTLHGGDGDDVLIYDSGDSYGSNVQGGAGNDTLDASAQTVSVGTSGGGEFVLRADIENFIGGSAADHVNGNAAANRIDGRGGADALGGDGGNDTLVGGGGADTLAGGAGTDTFVLDRQAGDTAGSRVATRIDGFGIGEKIDVTALGLTMAALEAALRNQHTATTTIKTVDFGIGNGTVTVALTGNLLELTVDDFIL